MQCLSRIFIRFLLFYKKYFTFFLRFIHILSKQAFVLYQISAVCRLVLGKAQRKALYDHLRTEDGRVPADQVSAALNEIFLALGPDAKN